MGLGSSTSAATEASPPSDEKGVEKKAAGGGGFGQGGPKIKRRAAAAGDAEADSEWPGLKALQAEIEELRASPPDFLVSVGAGLSTPSIVCNDEGELEEPARPKAEGPWDLLVTIRGGISPEERKEIEDLPDDPAPLRARAREVKKALDAANEKLSAARLELAGAASASASSTAEPCAAAAFRALPSVATWLGVSPAALSAGAPATDEGPDLDALACRVQEADVEAKRLAAEDKEARGAVEEDARRRSILRAADAYDFPFQVCIRFSNEWPVSPPSNVRFQCVFHHALVDDEGSMPKPFYNTLPKEGKCFASAHHTLRGVVQALHDFLRDPLRAWGVPADAAPERFTHQLMAAQEQNEKRLSTIRKYRLQLKHPCLFETPARWRQEWFDPAFWEASQRNTPDAWRAILNEHLPGEVFSFRMFTEEFCKIFVEEIFNFYESGLPARRPNSMNNYGIILNEIGLEPMIDELQRMLQPLGELFWPGPGSAWDGHHCFIVRYRENEDLGLDMHTDDADVTFNICLGLDFKGAGLQFCGLMGAPNHRKHTYTYKHVKGTCVFHLGRKRHGADDISEGERLNLILWNHSSTYRQSNDYNEPDYDTEVGPPDQVCVSYTHDRDYGVFKEYPKGKENFKGRGWCPPRQFEYEGFKPDSEKVQHG